MPNDLAPLRIGIIGSGFIARFHLQSFIGVRNARVAGVFSPTAEHRDSFAQQANDLDLGPCRPFASLEEMAGSGEVDAVWILGPNDTRLDHMRAIADAVAAGAPLRGVACEKPLARNLAEAREVRRLAVDAGLNHGYLENIVFTPAVERGRDIIWRRGASNAGRPYLARATEEHSGPHARWFWQGARQGGGVVTDMMCHSVEVCRYLLTAPGESRDSLRVTSVNGSVASLKWTQPAYARRLQERYGSSVDYLNHPSEDFARAIIMLEDSLGQTLAIETTTSWAYVGPGLRTRIELLGPEYALDYSTLDSGLKVFLSREIAGAAGEDLVEKQNAEQGLMPVTEDEPTAYGYIAENRHMVEAFRRGDLPRETFDDGVAVLEMLMAVYRSAELGRTVHLPDPELETYVPPVARET